MKVRKGVPKKKASKYQKYLHEQEAGWYIEDLEKNKAQGVRQSLYVQKKKQGLNYSPIIRKQENGLFSVGLK